MPAASPVNPIEPPAFLRDIHPYRDLRPMALEPQLTAKLGLDPAHTYIAAAASQESVPALVAYYQSQLAAAGWQVAQRTALTGQEQTGIQIVFSRARGHGLQTLILLCATPQSLAGNIRTAALAGKLPPGTNLLLEAVPIPSRPFGEPLSPSTSRLPQGVAADNLHYELGGGWTASAQITYPSHGKGPFPTLVLVHGSGKHDMDETLPEEVAGVPGGSKFFRPIALRLPQRGFAVIRYNKRGVVGLGPQLSRDPRFLSIPKPFTRYLIDTRTILEKSRQLKQVDPNRLLLLGHSEGTVLSSLIARSEDCAYLAGLVLMGVAGYNARTIAQYQFVDRTVEQIARFIDRSQDGRVSVADFFNWFETRTPAIRAANVKLLFEADQASTWGYRFKPELKPDENGEVEIHTYLRDYLVKVTGLANFPHLNGLPADMVAYFEDFSHYGSVTRILPGYMRPVLMLNGENDAQTIVEGARRADEALEEAGNPDHTLVTYPGLGHTFYPVKGIDQPLGPPRPDVIEDLGDWLIARYLH